MDLIIYPIGKFIEQPFSESELRDRLLDIRFAAQSLELAVNNLDEFQLNTAYREGGWTVKQVVHHLADSHMNAFIRCKLALTEDNPTIKPYDQNTWVNTPDAANVPINVSITLLHALHIRWHELFNNLNEQDFQRTVMHPEYKRQMTLWFILGLYAWHGKHHTAQIQSLRDRMNW
ncbi:MAG: putative metal-dependent hydrolase [Bacteroidota bacterium]